jgi:hypothetical protein
VSELDPFDDPSYGAFVESCAKECRCCCDCSPGPCAGAMAGGFCDRMCFCDRDEDEDHDD